MKKMQQCVAPLIVASLAGLAAAQPVLFTQWNFNVQPTGVIVNNPSPSIGRGTAVPLGMTNGYTFTTSPPRTGSTTACDVTGAGASGDTASSPNNCWRVRGSFDGTLANAGVGYANAAPPFTQGAEFDVSTVNYSGIVFTFDWFTTNQGVRNMQVQYSTNGGGTWTSIGPVLNSATNGWINNNTFDFTSIPAANDNPNFRVRLVSVYDPNPAAPALPNTRYSNPAGQPYNNASGNWRFDRVGFAGTPIRSIGPSVVVSGVTPSAVCSSGGPLTFSVQVEGGANPISTGLAVSADLSSLGLSATQALFDDGTSGDVFAGDGVFTYAAAIPGGRTLGNYMINAAVSDAQSRTTSTTIPVVVGDCSQASAARVVISQTFAGGGNLGAIPAQDAPFNADYVEIYNRSNQVVSLNGWSIQYASQTSPGGFDNAGDRVLLAGNIRPGQYMLVRMSDPIQGFGELPAPDFAQLLGLGGMGSTGGRVALVRTSTLLGTNYASTDIEDFVGYGGAITFEGAAPAARPNPSSNTALLRQSNGAQDSNQNFYDVAMGSPNPRNRASNGFLAGYPSADLAAVCSGTSMMFYVRVSPGSGSTGISVNADVSEIAGSPATFQLFDNGSNGDVNANDGIYSASYTLPGTALQGYRTVGFTVSDQQGQTDVSTIPVAVAFCGDSPAPVVISKVYGGGGNDASGYNGDFAELFNRSTIPINLTGWSFQSCRISDQGFDSRIAFLSGIINPGEYRLIVTNQLSATGAQLPTPDFQASPNFGMESQFGRVALSRSSALLHSNFNSTDIVDFVGYGSQAQNFEGIGPTGTLSDVLVAVRRDGGCRDTNQNAIDFDVVLALDLPFNSSTPIHTCPPPRCLADVDDGTSSGTPDGGVTIDDLLYYLAVFEAGDVRADVDDGSSTGTPDGGVTIDDLLYYLVRFEGGC